jgi:uncharacterized membrane protein YbhN (UPF0104 family)
VSIVAQWLVAQAVGIEISLAQLASIICMVTLIVLLPISFNGIGLQEVSFVAFLTGAGVSQDIALSFSLLTRVLIVGTSLIAGLVAFTARSRP